MVRPSSLQLLLFALALAPLGMAAGCSSGPGQSFLSQGHSLLETAESLRWVNAQALKIPRELEKEPLPTYVVEPGDVLLIQPIELDSPVRLPGDQPILPDGTINLGKYGHLVVAGKTVPEIETMVRAAVQVQTKDAGFISVRLVSRQSKVYYVVGDVNSPGVFQLNGRETVLDGLMAAGGLTDNASRDNIILSRPTRPNCCRVVLPVCFREIVQLGDTTTNYQLAPGDRIYVPSRTLMETVFGRHCSKSPCGGAHTACVLPPYPGGPCCDGPGGTAPGYATPLPPAGEPVRAAEPARTPELPAPAPLPARETTSRR